MKHFPQYRLEDFYRKHYWQGGLHILQIKRMHEYIAEDEKAKNKFQAIIHGIDLDKASKKKGDKKSLDEQEKKQDLPIFRDPDSYDEMSQEERDRLTQKMMRKHRQWAHGTSKSLGKGSGNKSGS